MHCLLQPEPEITQAAITAVFADRNAEMEIRHPPQAFDVFEQPETTMFHSFGGILNPRFAYKQLAVTSTTQSVIVLDG